MKEKCLFYFSLCSLLFFTACGNNDDAGSTGGEGKVLFYLSSDTSFPKEGAEGGEGVKQPYEDIKNYKVELANSKGNLIVDNVLYGELPVIMDVEGGTYSVRAYYGENAPAGYDQIFVEGKSDFTVKKNNTESIEFKCVPANAKIKVVYSEDFFSYYSDCAIGFKTPHLDQPFTMLKADSEKALFLKAGDNEELIISFELKDLDGAKVTPAGFGAQRMSLSARDFITLTVKPKITAIEGGQIRGIEVIIDDKFEKEEVIDIVIPGPTEE